MADPSRLKHAVEMWMFLGCTPSDDGAANVAPIEVRPDGAGSAAPPTAPAASPAGARTPPATAVRNAPVSTTAAIAPAASPIVTTPPATTAMGTTTTAPTPPAPPRKPRAPPGALPTADALPSASYADLVAAIEADRQTFARYDARAEARTYLRDAIAQHLFPAWKGTPWAFYGATEAPGEGAIACGYWVASILRDVGFRIDRDHVGKQASEKILLTFTAPDTLRHFGSRPVDEVIARVRRYGEGLWGVGLANHAGFVWNDGTQVYFCHSNYTGVQGPMCEEAERSGPFRTSYTVIGSVLGDATVDAWLEGRRLATGTFGQELPHPG